MNGEILDGRSRTGSDYDSDKEFRRSRSRSRGREKDKHYRGDYDSRKRGKDRRGDNSCSRWERKSEDGKTRDRDRSYRENDRDSVDR